MAVQHTNSLQLVECNLAAGVVWEALVALDIRSAIVLRCEVPVAGWPCYSVVQAGAGRLAEMLR